MKPPTLDNPPHLRDDSQPCAWCGAVWRWVPIFDVTRVQVGQEMTMHHRDDCAYMRASGFAVHYGDVVVTK